MLTLPVYRALPCATGAPLPARPFVVRETAPVTPPKPHLFDRVRAAMRARHSVGASRRPTSRDPARRVLREMRQETLQSPAASRSGSTSRQRGARS